MGSSLRLGADELAGGQGPGTSMVHQEDATRVAQKFSQNGASRIFRTMALFARNTRCQRWLSQCGGMRWDTRATSLGSAGRMAFTQRMQDLLPKLRTPSTAAIKAVDQKEAQTLLLDLSEGPEVFWSSFVQAIAFQGSEFQVIRSQPQPEAPTLALWA